MLVADMNSERMQLQPQGIAKQAEGSLAGVEQTAVGAKAGLGNPKRDGIHYRKIGHDFRTNG